MNYPSVNEDNRGVFQILTQTMVAAKREGVQGLGSLYDIGKVHNIDPWDLDEASELELNKQYSKVKKQA